MHPSVHVREKFLCLSSRLDQLGKSTGGVTASKSEAAMMAQTDIPKASSMQPFSSAASSGIAM